MKPSSVVTLLLALRLSSGMKTGQRCGLRMAQCNTGSHCEYECDGTHRCVGHCISDNALQLCGDFSAHHRKCADGYKCVKDPRPPFSSNVMGFCLPLGREVVQLCGGISDSPCGNSTICHDIPTDDCTPEEGDSDCRGICL